MIMIIKNKILSRLSNSVINLCLQRHTFTFLPGSTGTTRKGPDLVGLGAAITAGVHQQLGAILGLRTINVDTIVCGKIPDVACGCDRPLLARLAGITRVEHEPLRLCITGRGVQTERVPFAAWVKCQRDRVVLELPDLVCARGT